MNVHICLRPWRIADLDNLVMYANNWNIARYLTDAFPYPYTPEKGRAFIEMANGRTPISIFAIEVGGEAVGAIGIHPQQDVYRKNAELGYWLAEPYWGQGIVSQAIGQVVAFGFRELDIMRIYARPFGTNLASQRVLEKTGFILEARLEKTLFKNGEYLDELIYAVRRSDVAV